MRPTCSTPECKNLAAKASKSGYRKVCNSCHRKKFYGRETCRYCTKPPLAGFKVCEEHRVQVAEKTRRWAEKYRLRALWHYSGGSPKCACCGESNVEFLALDHVDGGGLTHRKLSKITRLPIWLVQRGFPTGFRVLCSNCNQSLGAYGYCPHENLTPEEKEQRRKQRRESWSAKKDETVEPLVNLPAVRCHRGSDQSPRSATHAGGDHQRVAGDQ